MNRLLKPIAMACLLASTVPATVFAQAAADVEDKPPKFLFGPLGVTPRIALKNVGVDTNPLNTPTEPERDFTATITPGLDSTFRIGRGRLTAKTSLDYVHFNRLRNQRSLNFNQEARAQLSLNRLTPYVRGHYLRTRQRPSPEIDLRVQQKMTGGGIGTGLRVGPRLRVEFEAQRSQVTFGEGTYGDENIASALDREARLGSLIGRYSLTPLTTLVVDSYVQHDRFRFATFRDNNSFSVVPGLELKPSALVSGKVSVGYRNFNALDPNVPDFAGVVGEIEALYIMRDSTAFGLSADRDVQYSVEETQPYYVTNGGMLTVTQILGGDWFVVGRLGETRLDYRNFLPTTEIATLQSGRTDRQLTRGAGIGRRIGDDVRVSFDVDYVRRRSTAATHSYQGFRFGGTITYGS